MRVLVTGNLGYIGTVLTPTLAAHGHEVVGLDTGFFQDCVMGEIWDAGVHRQIRKDVRDVQEEDLRDVDAVVHLAALSNDPMGEFDPELTLDVNYRASVRLAALAKDMGVQRFIFASSCSIYGQSDEAALTEHSPFNPQTAYARSKVLAEAEIRKLAGARFSPIFMRNSTAYGYSPRLRFDIAVNNLTGWGFTTGQVKLLSDGQAWRPFVHVDDIARATALLLSARSGLIHNQAFNIGSEDENYRIVDVADCVAQAMPGCVVTFGERVNADNRTYNVSFAKLRSSLPWLDMRWSVAKGVQHLKGFFERTALDFPRFESREFTRLKQIRYLIESGIVDAQLRPTRAPVAV
jgi:nucleoside-diphosphate-sugar epimerase